VTPDFRGQIEVNVFLGGIRNVKRRRARPAFQSGS